MTRQEQINGHNLQRIADALDKIADQSNRDVETKTLITEALYCDGGHHKQWYLEEIAKSMGLDISNWDIEEGIAP